MKDPELKELVNMRIQLIACIAFMIMGLWGSVFGDEIIYSQNFDNLDDGDIFGQDGWASIDELSAGMAAPQVQSDVALSGKALEVEAFHEAHIRWPEPVETGTCYLSIFFRKEDADASNTLHIYMGKGPLAWTAGPVIRIGSQSGDPEFIGIHDGSDANIVQAAKFQVGKWHHIREVIDVGTQTFDVYLDGKKLGNFMFRNEAHNAIEWLMIGFDEGVGLLGYYDAVEFGLGKGEGAFVRATPVESLEKLSTTWGTLKVGY